MPDHVRLHRLALQITHGIQFGAAQKLIELPCRVASQKTTRGIFSLGERKSGPRACLRIRPIVCCSDKFISGNEDRCRIAISFGYWIIFLVVYEILNYIILKVYKE